MLPLSATIQRVCKEEINRMMEKNKIQNSKIAIARRNNLTFKLYFQLLLLFPSFMFVVHSS